MIDSLPHPIIFAHRGASAHAPENTLPSFQLAAEQGARALELDAQLTADGAVVVFHDSTVDRTTNGKGRISDLTLAEIKTLRIAGPPGSSDQQESIPTLEEVFSALPLSILINIELKNLTTPFDKLPETVCRLIRDENKQDQVLVSSFNPLALSRFHRCLPDVPLGRLVHKAPTADFFLFFPWLIKGFRSIHLSSAIANKHRVASFHSHGKLVFTYTLNRSEDILKSLQAGVDGFFTDDPGQAIKSLLSDHDGLC
jgi:glycerophosphoryl diester phosphodiesterase